MGVDLQAIFRQRLSPAEVPLLPQALSGHAAPCLAGAIEQFARVTNRQVTAPGWRYDEPRYGFYLDGEGREVEPPPFDAPEPGVLYPLPTPDVCRKVSVSEVWDMGNWVTMYGPAFLHLYVARRCTVLSPVYRWGRFLREPSAQTAFRHVCRELARLLDSPRAIYVPDSTYAASVGPNLALDHQSFDVVVAWLLEHYGPPPLSISAIHTEESRQGADGSTTRVWQGDGYFIDTFAEL